MSGMLKDMLAGILFDALKIDTTANGGKGNTDVMGDQTFNLIVGAIEELFVQNGAPAVHYSADAATIPFPRSTICLIGCLPAATALILHLTPSSPPATAESTSPITSCRSLTTSPECFLRFCPHSVLSLTPPLHIRHPTLPLPSLSTLIERSFSPAPRTQIPTSISPLRRVRTASA